MNRLRVISSITLSIYLAISFFSGFYFYAQGEFKCAKNNGWLNEVVFGCDLLQGNFAPTEPPSFVSSQFKGLIWPYYLFAELSKSNNSKSNHTESYPFEVSVEEQLTAISSSPSMLDIAKITTRCSVTLKQYAKEVRQANVGLYEKLNEGSKKLNSVSDSAMLMHIIMTGDILDITPPIDISKLRSKVKNKVAKQAVNYQMPFDTLIEIFLSNGVSDRTQEVLNKDLMLCVEKSKSSYSLAPLEVILDKLASVDK